MHANSYSPFFEMKIVKQVILILCVSFIAGFTFNTFSPNGIGVLDNPWSRNGLVNSSGDEEPIMFIDFNRACQFIENKEGMILDARNPEDYAEGHIPGSYLLFFYTMNEYYPKLEELLQASPALLTYCSDVHCEDSEFLANELLNLGYMPIYVYKGGIEDWKSRQMPVETGEEETES